jgi:uncharacterized protein (DUF1919 family)
MYDYLEKMTEHEWAERYRECVRMFNSVIQDEHNTRKRLKSKNLNINYLEYDTCYEKMVEKLLKIGEKKKVIVKKRKA